MQAAKDNNASSSATMSTSAPGSPQTSAHEAGESEAQFLQAQAERARTAINAALAELGQGLGKGLNPVQWTQDHPLISLGVGIVAGFAAATTLVPSKEEQALRHLRRIETALHRPSPREEFNEHSQKSNGKEKSAEKGFGGLLLTQVVSLIKPVLASFVSSMMSAHHQAQPSASDEPGASDSAATG